MHRTAGLVQVCALLWCLMATMGDTQVQACHCARSNSTYLAATTAATPSTTPGAVATASTTAGGSAELSSTGTPVATSATTGDHLGTSTTSPYSPGYTRADNATLLSTVFGTHAFIESSAGFTFNASSNQFAVPRTAAEDRIVVDLRIGQSGSPCRPMPFIEHICVSSLCEDCNLNRFTAAAANTLSGGSAFVNRIFYPTPVVNTTVCAGREVFQDLGDFRYIVFLPQGSPAPSQPYAFRVSLSGNFSSYSCSSRRRRGLLDGPPGDSGTGPVDGDVGSFFWQLSRSRRAAPDDCSCPVGQDPVFSSVRTVLISWEFPLKAFSSSLSDTGTAEYLSLARESYYLLMDAVRNASVSNLTSVVADFFDIAFSRVVTIDASRQYATTNHGNSSSSTVGTRLTGRLTVRNDTLYSDSFLQQQLRVIIPGYGSSIVNLRVGSQATVADDSTPPAGLPGFAVALICVFCFVAAVTVVAVVMWRLDVFGDHRNQRFLQYRAGVDGSAAAAPAANTNAGKDGELRLGAIDVGEVTGSPAHDATTVDAGDGYQNVNRIADFWADSGNAEVHERAV